MEDNQLDEMTELAARYKRPGFEIRYLSQVGVASLGMRGYRQILHEAGDPVKTTGGMLLCEIPTRIADSRASLIQEIVSDQITQIYGSNGIQGALERAGERIMELPRPTFIARLSNELKQPVAKLLVRFRLVKASEQEKEMITSLRITEARYLQRKAVQMLWWGTKASLRRQNEELVRRCGGGL